MTLHVITHKHTNIYLMGEGRSYILFDCGWQDSFPVIKAALRDYGVGFTQIAGVFVSHFHPDHAGCVELLRRHGIKPLILERQVSHISWLNDFFNQKKNDPSGKYVPLDESVITSLTLDAARRLLAKCGLGGSILYTPGHTEDSVSLVIGDTAFTGDLPPYETAASYGRSDVAISWERLLSCGVTRVYPAHGESYEIGGN